MKFGNIIYKNRNQRLTIGDDIQLYAVENLYNYMGIDYNEVIRIPLDKCWDYDGEDVILPISFPLLAYHGKEVTCFSSKIHPVFLGVCILTTELSENDIVYLKKHEPIGCRDYHTYKTMQKYNIMSYVGGCLTLGFPTRWELKNKKSVYCIDLPEDFKEIIPYEIMQNSVFTSHTYYFNELTVTPEDKTKLQYEEYINNAKMIITTRMHAALPCIAAGIPVVFAKDVYSYRFCGIDSIANIYTKEEYGKINWNPSPIYYEKKKREILNFAAKRVLDIYNNKTIIDYEISHLLFPKKTENYYIEFYDNTIEFIKNNWDDTSIEYVLWGVTQLAKMLYIYIQYNYPRARLVNVIDRARTDDFCGVCTTTKEKVSNVEDKFVFVCTGGAIKEANEYLVNKRNYYQCCGDNVIHDHDYNNSK